MSRFESSRFVRNPKVMHVDILKSTCDALGWSYSIKGNELLVTDAKQGSKLYGEYALKVNLATNEVTYNTYYMPNAEQRWKNCKISSMHLMRNMQKIISARI